MTTHGLADARPAFQRPLALLLLALTQVAVLSLWFATAAVAPSLAAEAGLGENHLAWLTSAVQAGFVAGCLVSAYLGLADRMDPRHLYAAAAAIAACANAAILIVDPQSAAALVLRFLTGAMMAGVYPVGMKIAVSWARDDRGLLVGLLVAALTVGSASPHLFAFFGGVDWRLVLVTASLAAFAGAVTILVVPLGPALGPSGRFDPKIALLAWRDKSLRLANFGYLGHMWELYAMWAWIGAFLAASFAAAGRTDAVEAATLGAFATIGIGALGAFGGGWMADRIGRTTLTMAALALSAACCLLAGALFGGPPGLLLALCLVWGVAVIADSAQFSACITELARPGTVGTMLTTQTAAGFTLTLVTIQAMPYWVAMAGWEWAFAPLAIGPLLGIAAMYRLRMRPEALRIAGGRR